MDDKVNYWLELSDYDLETAKAMLTSKRYLYVGFMCHQTIEKVFKAWYTKLKKETAPFTHNLSFLAKKGAFYDNLSEDQKDFIDLLEPLNIETRYPTHKEKILRSLNAERCVDIFENTQKLQEWIKSKLLIK